MKLTNAAETIIIEDNGVLLRRHIAKLEKDKNMLQRTMDLGIDDYNLVDVHSDTTKRIADHEAKVKSAEAHYIDTAAEGVKILKDFEGALVQKLEELLRLYNDNVRTIRGLCSPMSVEEPSSVDYLCWLSEEVSGLPHKFRGVNENFASAAIEGTLAMAGDSIDLDAVRNAAANGGTDVLPAKPDLRKIVRAVSKKWWRPSGYDYVLFVIHAKQQEVFVCFWLLL
jgi:hypothetical protein